MLKKICKIIIIIPAYIFFALEGCFGGTAVGKYNDPWDKVIQWIKK